jgi:hypothetical protein
VCKFGALFSPGYFKDDFGGNYTEYFMEDKLFFLWRMAIRNILSLVSKSVQNYIALPIIFGMIQVDAYWLILEQGKLEI